MRTSPLFDNVSSRLCLDQHGQPVWAKNVSELVQKAGGTSARKMYVDKIKGEHAGKSVHCGYIVGRRWFSVYQPVEVPA